MLPVATLRQIKKAFYNSLALSLSHPKTFWGLYHSIISLKQRVLPVLHRGTEEATDTIAKAELLNKQFTSTFTSHVNHQTPYLIPTPPAGVPCLSSVHCDSSEVFHALVSTRPNVATGPDDISSKTLRGTAEQISQPLTSLFNHSLHQGIFPSSWKLCSPMLLLQVQRSH